MLRALLLATVAAAVLAAQATAAGPTKTLKPGQTRTYAFGTFVHGGAIACAYGHVRAVAKFPPLPARNTIRFASAFGVATARASASRSSSARARVAPSSPAAPADAGRGAAGRAYFSRRRRGRFEV